MTEQEALLYFDSLPVDDRLRLMQRMLSDMESRISRARTELDGTSSPLLDSIKRDQVAPRTISSDAQPDFPGLELPPLPNQFEAAEPADPVFGQLENPTAINQPDNEWDQFKFPPETGGDSHAVHKLRLMDAAAQYERLLKRYGYIKSPPGMGELTRRLRNQKTAVKDGLSASTWAEWVARDQETLDRPKPQQWQDWVVIGDDDGDYQ